MTPQSIFSDGWLSGGGTQPQAVAFEGWMGFPVVNAPEWPFNTFSGPGKLDPYSDPFRWQHHREDDEIMAIISAFLAVN